MLSSLIRSPIILLSLAPVFFKILVHLEQNLRSHALEQLLIWAGFKKWSLSSLSIFHSYMLCLQSLEQPVFIRITFCSITFCGTASAEDSFFYLLALHEIFFAPFFSLSISVAFFFFFADQFSSLYLGCCQIGLLHSVPVTSCGKLMLLPHSVFVYVFNGKSKWVHVQRNLRLPLVFSENQQVHCQGTLFSGYMFELTPFGACLLRAALLIIYMHMYL